jgi:hypothetical protein
MKERLQGSMGKAAATMRLVAAVGQWQRGKNEWQGKGTQRPTRAYIARMGRRAGKSKETTKSNAFSAKTMGTTMITFSFFSLTVRAHMTH